MFQHKVLTVLYQPPDCSLILVDYNVKGADSYLRTYKQPATVAKLNPPCMRRQHGEILGAFTVEAGSGHVPQSMRTACHHSCQSYYDREEKGTVLRDKINQAYGIRGYSFGNT